jgi:hypothetical protein
MYPTLIYLCLWAASPTCPPALHDAVAACLRDHHPERCVAEQLRHPGVTILRGQGDPPSSVTILRGPNR